MKHALVPVSPTDEMVDKGDSTQLNAFSESPSQVYWNAMLAASPNGGKVSEEQFDAVWKITNNLKIARAVIEALGLEVEE